MLQTCCIGELLSAFPFHAAVRMYDCVTFYFNFMLFSYVYEPDQFFIKQKKVFGEEEKRRNLRKFFHTRFRLRYSHKVP